MSDSVNFGVEGVELQRAEVSSSSCFSCFRHLALLCHSGPADQDPLLSRSYSTDRFVKSAKGFVLVHLLDSYTHATEYWNPYRSNEEFSGIVDINIVFSGSVEPASEALLLAVLVQLCRVGGDAFFGLVALVPPEKAPLRRPVRRYGKKR